jgi:hypothetical protein
MSDELIVRTKARAVIEAGTLPNRHPDRIWGGPGVGTDCAICAAPVTRAEVEYEIEFARNGEGSGVDTYHVHMRCLAAWISERSSDAKPSGEQP